MSCNPCKKSSKRPFDDTSDKLLVCNHQGQWEKVDLPEGGFGGGLSEEEITALIESYGYVTQAQLTQCKDDLTAELTAALTADYCRKVDELRVELNNNISNEVSTLQEKINNLQLQINECCNPVDECDEVLVVSNCQASETVFNEITFTATITGEANPDDPRYTYSWELSDESIVSGRTFTQVFAAEGTYTGTVTVTDSNFDPVCVGESTTGPCTIIFPDDQVSLSCDINSECTEITVVTTTGVANPTYSYTVNGSALPNTTESFIYPFTENGNYAFEVTVGDQTAVCTANVTCIVNLSADINCSYDSNACTVAVDASGSVGATIYTFFLNGSIVQGPSASATYNHTVTTNENHEFSVLVGNGDTTKTATCQDFDTDCVPPVCGTPSCTYDNVTNTVTVTSGATGAGSLAHTVEAGADTYGPFNTDPFSFQPNSDYSGDIIVTTDNGFQTCSATAKTISWVSCPTADSFNPVCVPRSDGSNCIDVNPGILPSTVTQVCATTNDDQSSEGMLIPSSCAIGSGVEDCGVGDSGATYTSGALGSAAGLQFLGSNIIFLYSRTINPGGIRQINIRIEGLHAQGDLQEVMFGVSLNGNNAGYTVAPDNSYTNWSFSDSAFNEFQWTQIQSFLSEPNILNEYDPDPCTTDGSPLVVCFDSAGQKTITLTYTIENCPDISVDIDCDIQVNMDNKMVFNGQTQPCNPCYDIPAGWDSEPGADNIVLTATNGFSSEFTLAQGVAGDACFTSYAANETVGLFMILRDAAGITLQTSSTETYTSGFSCALVVSCEETVDGIIIT